jgi:predicted phosphodiesterase
MKSFNWLHLSDLHFGQHGQAPHWPNVLEAFWKDLDTLHEKSGPWDAVLFTGDLVQSGSETEFKELEDKVLGPLWVHLAKLGSKTPVLLAVPGNHDLVRPEPEKPKAALRLILQKNAFGEIAEEFWSDPSCEYREIVSVAFANYQAWSKKNIRNNGVTLNPGILPGDFAASISIQKDDCEPLKIGIAGINTTFLQLAKGDYNRRLVLDPRQLHQACCGDLPAWTKDHDACILMTHQGLDWLDPNSANEAYAEVNPAGRFDVHLFGHMHENAIHSSATGGGKFLRRWQGNSLFGLETFGEPPRTEQHRRHGYGAGRIEFDNDGATIRHWPRRAIKNGVNGWKFSPDNDSCDLVESDSGTTPERLEKRTGKPKIVEGSEGGTPKRTVFPCVVTTPHQRHLKEMEMQLQHALEAFKGHPIVFIEPKLSKTREFNDKPNELHLLMEKPHDTLIIAPPEFGLTCLGLYLQLEAFKKCKLWLYIDAEQTKGRKIFDHIEEELLHYDRNLADLKCIVLDSWNAGNFDHLTMVKSITSKCPDLPLVILAEDTIVPDVTGNVSKLDRNFAILHLQALSRSSMRQLVAGYNETKHIGTEDVLLSGLVEHMESINIHRTPLNCYTLLRVLDSSYNETLLNKSKLLKAILFVLFTDHNSFSYSSNKPEVDECTYVLGHFCKDLVTKRTRSFEAIEFSTKLSEICKSACLVLNIEAMLDVLLENNILVKRGGLMEFRHRYWIFYFAAEWMRHDDNFRQFILSDLNYVNYPEIIEFYSGLDGKRTDAVETLLTDLTALIDKVEKKIGIARSFDPLSPLLWNPSDEFIQKARSQIAEKVETSNLPANIKDKYADRQYQSAAPYDQSISTFLNDYSVLCLLNSIKAASRALRSSPFVDVELKHKLTSAIIRGWEEISRVVFWLSPLLAKDGRAIHDGFALMLSEGFSTNIDQRFKENIICNPSNIVRMLGGDLASKKICPLLNECFQATDSMLQKHMISIFIATVRPEGWDDSTLSYINLLHPRSFYLGDIFGTLTDQVTLGDLEHEEEPELKKLTRAILSKREYAPKVSDTKEIPPNKLLNEENELPIDQLLKGNRQRWPYV